MSFVRKHWCTLTALALMSFGAVYLCLSLAAQGTSAIEYRPIAMSATKTVVNPVPARLILSRLGLDVTVQQGSYDAKNHSWKLDSQHAFLVTPGQEPLLTTSWPLIYGHLRSEVFAPLSKVERGDILEVVGNDGRTYEYAFAGSVAVTPEQGALINSPPQGHGLQLLTCEGLFFDKRRILYFTLINAESAPTKDITI